MFMGSPVKYVFDFILFQLQEEQVATKLMAVFIMMYYRKATPTELKNDIEADVLIDKQHLYIKPFG